jgi:class 3 adenylate cyclase
MDQPLAIQFSDLRGFTSLTAERGDREAFRLARAFVELVEQEVAQHGGRVLKTYGDGVMTSFDEAERAVHCAVAMQRSVCERYCTDDEDLLSAGIGISWGPAIRTDGDLFGHSVNLAKRLSDSAKGGQIVATSDVCSQTGDVTDVRFRDLGDRDLKGIGSERLYEVVWREEVAKLDTSDDSVELILTEDKKLVIGFAKQVEKEMAEVRQQLDALGENDKGLEGILKRAIARRVSRSIPKLVDWAGARAGMGIEHDLADVRARIHRGNLEILVNDKKRLDFGRDQVSPENAQLFLARLRELQSATD